MSPLKAPETDQAPQRLEESLENKTGLERKNSATKAAARPIAFKPKKAKKGRLRKVGSAIARHPRITQSVLLLALISGTSLFLLYSLFKGAWSSEQDNLKILNTILKMEIARESAIALEDSSNQVVTRSFQSLEPYVENDGWTWVNRFGSTITYSKQEQLLIASCSPYSPLYMICSLSEIP